MLPAQESSLAGLCLTCMVFPAHFVELVGSGETRRDLSETGFEFPSEAEDLARGATWQVPTGAVCP